MIRKEDVFQCPIEVTMAIVGGKWKVVLLWHLRKEALRPTEIKKLIPDISDKMLTQQLRELQSDGLVEREDFGEVPPKVEYRLTKLGQTLVPLFRELGQWGKDFLESLGDESPTVVVLQQKHDRAS